MTLDQCVDCLVKLAQLKASEALERMDACTREYYAQNSGRLAYARMEVRKAFGDKMAEQPDNSTTQAMLAELDRWLPPARA